MAHIITDAEAQSLIKIANSIIGPLVNQGLIKKNDMPDAVQELLAEVVRLSDSYDENSEAEFTTYAHGVMRKQVLRVIRKLYSPTNRMLTGAVSIDEILDAEDSDDTPDYNKLGITPSSLTENIHESKRQEFFCSIQEVVKTLPKGQRNICHLLMDGYSVLKIARMLGGSRKVVRNSINSIKTAFIKAGISPQKKKF